MMRVKPSAHLDHLFRRLRWNDLDAAFLRRLVEIARDEDIAGAGLACPPSAPGDVSTRILGAAGSGRADLVARRDLRACALPLIPVILDVYGGGEWQPAVKDGDFVPKGGRLGTVSGETARLLQAERVMLNFLQRLCGVAAHTAAHVAALGSSPTKLLDTRKTTPGFRVLEKYAVACGGGWNHRIGLFDRVMLKDNHLASSHAERGEALARLVRRARAENPSLAIEVEVDHLDQVPPVLEAGADVVMFDNFSLEEIRAGVGIVGDRAWTEGSGGVSLAALPELGKLGLDFISCGAIVHQAPWVDIGLDWRE